MGLKQRVEVPPSGSQFHPRRNDTATLSWHFDGGPASNSLPHRDEVIFTGEFLGVFSLIAWLLRMLQQLRCTKTQKNLEVFSPSALLRRPDNRWWSCLPRFAPWTSAPRFFVLRQCWLCDVHLKFRRSHPMEPFQKIANTRRVELWAGQTEHPRVYCAPVHGILKSCDAPNCSCSAMAPDGHCNLSEPRLLSWRARCLI